MNGDSYSSRGAGGGGGDRYGGHGSTRDYHTADHRSDRRERDRGDRSTRDRNERPERGERRRDRSRSPHARSSRRGDDYYGGGGGGGADGAAGGNERGYRTRDDRYGGGRDRDFDRHDRRGGDRRGGERSGRYEDARGGGRRGGRPPPVDEQDVFPTRRRSATPPPRKKEPTPDLTDVMPILERRRRMTMWDIKPEGYENVTSEQAKLSGMFPLPGAPRQAPMDPTRLHAFMTQPSSVATASALKPTNSRQSKRLLISNLPQTAKEDSLQLLFNDLLASLNVTIGGPDPVTQVSLNADKSLAMVEFKNTNDATVCLAFNGLEYEGKSLDIRRPKDYIVPLSPDETGLPQEPGQISSNVPDTPNKILVSQIPEYLQDEQVIELLKSFGELKAFVLVKDSSDESSKGIAFCEYVDPAATDIAVEGLNNMEIGDQFLKVQRASIGMKQAAGVEMGVNAMAMMAGTTSADLDAGRVLQLLNMVTPEELMDNDEYEEICEDINSECSKYGKLIDMKIPRPSGGSRPTVGVGKIFVRFESKDSAEKALKSLAGRKFADRTVVCTFFSEENYEVGAF